MIEELAIRNWRMSVGIPHGVHLWFDPSVESVRLFRSSPADSALLKAEESVRDAVAEGEDSGYLDRVGSVSAYGQAGRPVAAIGEQLRLFDEDPELPF